MEKLRIEELLDNKEFVLRFSNIGAVNKFVSTVDKNEIRWGRILKKELYAGLVSANGKYIFFRTEYGHFDTWGTKEQEIDLFYEKRLNHYTVVAVVKDFLIVKYDGGPSTYKAKKEEGIRRYEESHTLEERIKIIENALRDFPPDEFYKTEGYFTLGGM